MKKKTVLIADDEAYIRLLVKSILSRDYAVLEAGDGEEAVQTALSQRPDLVLLDIMMPRLDGVGVCSIIKTDPTTARTPVIMVSARGDKLDREYAGDMGVDGYIIKPFDAQELLDTVNSLFKTESPISVLARDKENYLFVAPDIAGMG